ncbi:MAG: glycerophosphodiester phosphodiesterase [Bryobacterales bacterium]|nr:glycerophosphodiester phosphodiesterase [Bryobacterales bacterium]
MTRRIAGLMLMSAWMGMTAGPVAVHGHRGARTVLPENTLPAFEYAIEHGADFIELDLAVTKDNVLVVSHDPIVNETICRGPRKHAVIREMTAAELREWDCGAIANPEFPRQKTVPGARIPTLDEVLALAPRGNFGFTIELKSNPQRPQFAPAPDEFARLVVDVIRRHKLEDRSIVQSFDFRTLRATRKIAPSIRLAALYSGPPKDFPSIAQEAQADIVAPNFKLVTPEVVQAAHRAGKQVLPWTPNEPAEWDRLIAAGVNGIITDDPAGLIAHLARRGLR